MSSPLLKSIPAVAIAGATLAVAAPTQAATTYVTAQTAGTKTVGVGTFMWGSSNAPAGTKVCSQVNLAGKWSTSQCSTVKSDHSYAVELTYGKNAVGVYTFRAVAGSAISAPVKLTRVRAAITSGTAPTKPAPLTYQGGTFGTAYTLYSGYNGVKVYLAQKALGMATGPMGSSMGPQTMAALKTFQKNWNAKHPSSTHLRIDGVLDEATWNALPIEKDKAGVRYPFTIDSWAKTADVMDNAQRDVRVAAMITFAKNQLGKPYIWGGTGPMGFDCSGLLLQAARAGGMKPVNVSNFTDIRTASDLSNQMMRDSEFQKGSLSNLHVGDFIYYGGSDGVAHHISMYVGKINGVESVINAVTDLNSAGKATSGSTRYSPLSSNIGWSKKLGVNRAVAL